MVFNIPVIITLLRFVLTPVFIYFALSGRTAQALGVFALAALTDALDGILARVLDQRTNFGANLDPLADKVLLVSAFVAFAYTGQIPAWLVLLVLARDVVILGGVLLFRSMGRKVEIKPTVAGKLATVSQIAVVLYSFAPALAPSLVNADVFWGLCAAAAVLAIYTGIEYSAREVRVQRGSGGTVE